MSMATMPRLGGSAIGQSCLSDFFIALLQGILDGTPFEESTVSSAGNYGHDMHVTLFTRRFLAIKQGTDYLSCINSSMVQPEDI